MNDAPETPIPIRSSDPERVARLDHEARIDAIASGLPSPPRTCGLCGAESHAAPVPTPTATPTRTPTPTVTPTHG